MIGVHELTEEIKNILLEKHPRREEAFPEVLLPTTQPAPESVIFEEISAKSIQKASMDLNGSGGPTQVDSDAWKHILCSKSYGNSSIQLAESLAALAKRLCTEDIHPNTRTV